MPPKPPGFFKLAGPGVVMVGLAIGAGELIIWPITTARFGAVVTWAAVLGITLQLLINIEVGRYTLATGESAYTAFCRLSPTWAGVFLALNVAGWLLPGWARTCAGAVKALAVGPGGPGEPWAWTALTFACVGLVLLGPRNIYGWIEKIVVTLTVVMLAGLVTIVLAVGNLAASKDLLAGVLDFGFKPSGMPAYELFSAVVFAGAGGTANLLFSYYLRDKGWGMAGRLDDRMESEDAWQPQADESNRLRWRAWFTHMVKDQTLFFWFTNLVTLLMFVFGALVVLRPAGIVPAREMLILEEATILGSTWGKQGELLFMLTGIACLFSTQLTLLDGVSRSCAELIRRNFAWASSYTLRSCYRTIALAWMVSGTCLTWAWGNLPPFVFLLSAGFFGGIAMAIYCPLLFVINTRLLPAHCRPSPLQRAGIVIVSLFYIAFALVSVTVVGGRLLGSRPPHLRPSGSVAALAPCFVRPHGVLPNGQVKCAPSLSC
ncbi:MAG: Nramp family divalent metal transporter [Candidatus Binatia bacterium]